MKGKFLTAALAAVFLGTAAYAHDCDKKEKDKSSSTSSSEKSSSFSLLTAPEPSFASKSEAKKEVKPEDKAQASATDNPSSGGNTAVERQGMTSGEYAAPAGVPSPDQGATGVGGSGSADMQSSTSVQSSDSTSSSSSSLSTPGGSMSVQGGAQTDTWTGGSGMDAVCPPGSEATGGSGEPSSSMSTGGSGEPSSSMSTGTTTQQQTSSTTSSEAFDTAAARREQEAREKEDKGSDMRGLTVMAGGGVEGYAFDLAPEIDPGVTWGVTAALKPSSVLGLEFAYTGAANEISDDLGTDGADIVRNGGQAALTLGLAATAVQPYILGGIGLSNYNVRADSERFSDDTVGTVPVGVGLRTHFGNFTADARFGYNFLFDQEFARGVSSAGPDDNFADTGNYRGTLNIGTTF